MKTNNQKINHKIFLPAKFYLKICNTKNNLKNKKNYTQKTKTDFLYFHFHF